MSYADPNKIIIKGARQHNLKNVDLEIPKNTLTVFTGVSGSGKSSLAMDTLYAEGQRRYVESLSSYARQFLGVMNKPDVDSIEGLSPAIAIDQKTTSQNPRSTVGTVTEIYDFLRLLFARIGHPHCPECGSEVKHQSVDQVIDSIFETLFAQPEFSTPRGVRFFLLAPVVKERKGEYSALFANFKKQGILRARIDGKIMGASADINLIKTNKHTIEALVSRQILTKKKYEEELNQIRNILFSAVENALQLGDGIVILSVIKDNSFDFPEQPEILEDYVYSEKFACPKCNISLPEIEPRDFSFNAPQGACEECDGLGSMLIIDPELLINPRLSVSEGGILPWSKVTNGSTWTYEIIKKVASVHKISLDQKIGELTKPELDKLLYGTGDQKYEVSYQKNGGHQVYTTKFEGIIPNLTRRHRETQSDYIRRQIQNYMVRELCPKCNGARLKDAYLNVTIDSKSIYEVTEMPLEKAKKWLDALPSKISEREQLVAEAILREAHYRLNFLLDVGLGYINLARTSAYLSGGEAQRIRLASQIGSGLSGVLYVLDEPSVGLHQRDQSRLISTLKHLRDLGNTVIVVEHDRDTMLQSDYIADFGPGAGDKGGEVVAFGTPEEIKKNPKSLTGKYLSGRKKVGDGISLHNGDEKITNKVKEDFSGKKMGAEKMDGKKQSLLLKKATGRNLKNIDFEIPLGKFVCVTGVSGSGKSSLVMDTLLKAVREHFGLKMEERPLPYEFLTGASNLDRVISIDQAPIGRTPRSNPATYTKVFDSIRELFAETQQAKIRGYKPGRFSFNVKGGRCEVCAGQGEVQIEMQFMPDVYVKCEVCEGKRYNTEALEIRYKDKTISDVLDMSVDEALEFFDSFPKIKRILKTLQDVGLGYIRLGQPAPTLSGGEAQRVKLALELSKQSRGSTLYILDEPTTGLHFADLEKLINIIKRLVRKGNTVLVIEHNLDVVAGADWVVDLGPEGGAEGGKVVFEGTVTDLKKSKSSYTGRALSGDFDFEKP